MKLLSLVAGIVTVSSSVLAAQALLTDAQVTASIRAGGDKKQLNTLIAECTAAPGFGESLGASFNAGLNRSAVTNTGTYRATFTSHYGLIALAAAERQRRYEPAPTVADISEDLRAPRLHLWIEPQGDSAAIDRTVDLAAAIDHVIIRAEDRPQQSAQPVAMTTEPVAFANLLGAQFTTTRALAIFEMESALSLSKERDLEVVVITKAGERKCNVSKDRVRRMFDAPK
jgi:hypothetical protein